jgi:hypothetical protein
MLRRDGTIIKLIIQSCTGGCEGKSSLQVCGCEEKILCMIFGVCNSVETFIVPVLKSVARKRLIEAVID